MDQVDLGGKKEGAVFFFREILKALDLWPSYCLREDMLLPRISGRNGKQLFGREARLAFYQALCSLTGQGLIILFDQGSRVWELTKKGKRLVARGPQAVLDAGETASSRAAKPLNGRLPTKKNGVLLVVRGDSYHVVPFDKSSAAFLF